MMQSTISFYPGPSKVEPAVKQYMAEAMDSGLLSVNHRSPEFIEMAQFTLNQLRAKLDIPEEYAVFFTSSSTECWEIIGESFIDQPALHLFNGAFGQKWYQYRQLLAPNALPFAFPLHRQPAFNQLDGFARQSSLICLTQNETSNGTQLKNRWMARLRRRYPQALVAVDATSSMGGLKLDWLTADIWFASVQKCFGLPAGLAVMVCSPQAIERARMAGHNRHYNSLIFMEEKMRVAQTTYTPNVLNIFLLGKVMQARPEITILDRHLKDRAMRFAHDLQKSGYQLLIPERRLRSTTVLAIQSEADQVANIKAEALAEGYLLGNGYGDWKTTTFRIANFPAHTDEEMEGLKRFLLKRTSVQSAV